MQELVHELEAALGDDINSLAWMSPATKVEAQKKLAAFRDKIGYPETWRDYSSVTVKRDDRVGNAAHASPSSTTAATWPRSASRSMRRNGA